MTSTPTSSPRSSSRRRPRSERRSRERALAVMAAASACGDGGHDVIEVRNLSKVYASQDGLVEALSKLSFAVADAEFVTIVGHSGCGKSTLLKIIAGLLPPS